jgi:hypothetical protein
VPPYQLTELATASATKDESKEDSIECRQIQGLGSLGDFEVLEKV